MNFDHGHFGILCRVSIAFFLAFSYSEAKAASLNACVHKRSGILRVLLKPNSHCRSHLEYPLSLTGGGTQGPPGPAGPQGPAGAPGPQGPAGAGALQVFDSNNTLVGTLLGQNSVVVKIGQHHLIFNNFQTGGFSVTPSSSVIFYHTSSDCSGQRYLPTSDLPRTAALDKTSVIIYPDDPAENRPIHSFEIFSASQSLTEQGSCSPLSQPQSFTVGPATTTPMPNFVPPFHL